MLDKFLSKLKSLPKTIGAVVLIATLVFGSVPPAQAASGGRIGGGSFRAPSRSYSPPRGGGYGYSSPGYGYGYGGGGFGFPFLLPFFWGGGFGGLFSILVFIAIANFLVKAFRGGGGGDVNSIEEDYGTVSVAKLQVGLLASARYLQNDLNELGLNVDTSTPAGRMEVLQESTLALLRHPEYWVYGNADSQKTNLTGAETKFNQWSLNERGKFTSETLTNYNNSLRQASDRPALPSTGELATVEKETGEYILVTLLVGVLGNLQLPPINSSDDLKRAIQQVGSTGGDRLLAVEVLWTPQAEGDVLTRDDILANYPDLKLV